MITTSEMRDVLNSKSLFAEFSDEELEQFIALLDPEEFAAGTHIVRQDEVGDCMYILVHGRATVLHHKDGREIQLAVLQPGDFFGELALVDRGLRSADVLADEDCVLLKITQPAVSALSGVYPSAAFKLLIAIGRLMVERLRKSNQRYVDSLLFPLAEAP